MAYTKDDLARNLSSKTDFSQAASKAFINILMDDIVEQLTAGNEITIPQLGKFETKLQKGRSGIVPGSSPAKEYTTQDKMVPTFKPSKSLKQSVAEGK